MNKDIVVIPARGGSKGIPRKNLRPIAGYPLIYYSIKAALDAKLISRVIVSTDDEEIALFAERFGASVLMRDNSLATDAATLDPVIANAVECAEKTFNESYRNIVTVQPTSPLVRPLDIDNVVNLLNEKKVDTVVSVVDDRHLTWTVDNGKAKSNYLKRVNRQELPENYKETGAVIGCNRQQLLTGTRIGNSVEIYKMPHDISHDIDTYADLYLCEAMLTRAKVVFSVVGYAEVGLGHAFRAVLLAHELVKYEIIFVCEEKSNLAAQYIQSNNYTVVKCANGKLAETIIAQSPDLVINDLLDTTSDYMQTLAATGVNIVNFEDLGSGTEYANLVVNALYPLENKKDNWLVGAEYFCLRDEFIYTSTKVMTKSTTKVDTVLVTFGGVDEGDLTLRTLQEIMPVCIEKNIKINIIVGPGYSHLVSLQQYLDENTLTPTSLIQHTKRISDHMCEADLAITSGGRTVLELASLKVPMIVICQNQRETTHTFASQENGVINLGDRDNVADGEIRTIFSSLVTDEAMRIELKQKMKHLDLTKGKMRVIERITALINRKAG